jgi:1-acyl-sn-glycerol-3-phosphate acyltransferase
MWPATATASPTFAIDGDCSRQWRTNPLINTALIILRPVIVFPSSSLLGRRLLRRFTVTLPGRNPVLQILSPSDLAQAVVSAVEHGRAGTFNVAPDVAVPLHAAIRLAGNHRIPLPNTLQRSDRRRETLDYLRYPWTVSNSKMKEHMRFSPRQSSVTVLLEQRGSSEIRIVPEQVFDDFGMDEKFVRFCVRTVFKVLCDFYWRIETQGMEQIPRDGRAVLVGTHRGFVPWDAVMALHLAVRETGRIPRFLTHPGLFKFPFVASLMTRLGGVIAWQGSAERVLEGGDLLGIYPEGVQGAFALHRNAYKIQPSRNTLAKVALRHQAPIVPFVNVGSADSLPVFTQVRSRTWTRFADWPCIPVSTFPFLPVPLCPRNGMSDSYRRFTWNNDIREKRQITRP